MKPTLGMEEGKTTVIMSETPMKTSNNGANKGRIMKGVIIATVAMVVIAVIVSVSVYFGMKATSDTYKEAWQTFKLQDGRVVEERITVTETSVDVKVPNQMEQLYDFEQSLVVRRFRIPKTGSYGPCYASDLDLQQAPSRTQYNDSVIMMSEGKRVKEKWEFTTEKVPSYQISEDVRNMCQDTEVYWMRKVEDVSVEKREACNDADVNYSCDRLIVDPNCLRCNFFQTCNNSMPLDEPVYIVTLYSVECFPYLFG